ncbi:hypothetical protein [Sphingobium yanoikuyae]|uniref:Uncharacterized protein n=1 Tax=Sphingobium yanoikuyae TaxID=13690 RepID=A0A291N5V3_SPHYA|nr:hypothetical protein [Sphingobium yanoikuyae]ATI82774.1 hypothetical protein A6768_24075 [Sphingobium yanoikuyae]
MIRRRLLLIGAALGIGLVIMLAENVAADIVVGRTPFTNGRLGFIDAPDGVLFHFVIAALPMLALALIGSSRRWLWAVAISMTALFVTFAVWQLRQDYLADFAGGANIGLGIIMMASPWITLIVMGVMALLARIIGARSGPGAA